VVKEMGGNPGIISKVVQYLGSGHELSLNQLTKMVEEVRRNYASDDDDIEDKNDFPPPEEKKVGLHRSSSEDISVYQSVGHDLKHVHGSAPLNTYSSGSASMGSIALGKHLGVYEPVAPTSRSRTPSAESKDEPLFRQWFGDQAKVNLHAVKNKLATYFITKTGASRNIDEKEWSYLCELPDFPLRNPVDSSSFSKFFSYFDAVVDILAQNIHIWDCVHPKILYLVSSADQSSLLERCEVGSFLLRVSGTQKQKLVVAFLNRSRTITQYLVDCQVPGKYRLLFQKDGGFKEFDSLSHLVVDYGDISKVLLEDKIILLQAVEKARGIWLRIFRDRRSVPLKEFEKVMSQYFLAQTGVLRSLADQEWRFLRNLPNAQLGPAVDFSVFIPFSRWFEDFIAVIYQISDLWDQVRLKVLYLINTDDQKALFQQHPEVGSFLIRFSASQRSNLVLAYRHSSGAIVQHLIRCHNKAFFIEVDHDHFREYSNLLELLLDFKGTKNVVGGPEFRVWADESVVDKKSLLSGEDGPD